MPAIQTSDLSGFLKPAEAEPIFNEAVKQSAFQRLFRRIPLGINGQEIPVVTSRPVANWVGEAAEKPKTTMSMGLKTITPKKLAAIAVMSSEVVRANPGNITNELRTELAGAFARAFDFAVGYNLGGDGTGTGPFDAALSQATKAVEIGTTAASAGGVHGDLVAVLSALVADGKKLTGFALGDEAEPLLIGAVDSNGRPIYTASDVPPDTLSPTLRMGSLINRVAYLGDGIANGTNLGFAGDWRKGAWGAVGGISYRVSSEATVTIDGTLTSLWEHNLVAVLAEAEYGFVLDSTDHFVKITDAV